MGRWSAEYHAGARSKRFTAPSFVPYPENMNPSKRLQDKVCLVTGATRGIGLAITRMLVAEGASVAICGRSEPSVSQAILTFRDESPSKVKGKVADVSDCDQVQELFAFVIREFGGLDVLVNNAGIGSFASVSDTTPEQWAATLATNLTGTFYCSREALHRFRKPMDGNPGGGHIVNISSLAGKNAFAGGGAYNASKFGVNGFSEALMLDARYNNVRVSTIAPGSVATEFAGGRGENGRDWKVWPEDVAEIVRMVLCMPSRSMVSYVEVRPSRPKRKA